MKSTIISLLLLVLVTTGALGQALSGKVSNAEGEPLAGAAIFNVKSGFGTLSNEKGVFQIKSNGGELSVSFIGYKTFKTIVADTTRFISVILEKDNILFEDILVSATRVSKSSPFSYENISKEELQERNNGEEIPQLLNLSPSVVSYSENGTPFGNTAFRVRGSDPSRINVTMDGIPVNDAESQAVFWVNMSDIGSSIEDIQIQRGVGGSTNGAASFGASVNIQTSAIEEEASVSASTTVGSYNTFKRSINMNSGLLNDHVAFSARLSKLSSDGYIDYSGMEHTSYFLSGAYFTDKSSFRVKLFGNNEHTQISWWGNPAETVEQDRKYNPAGWYTDLEGNLNYYEDQADNYKQTHLHAHYSYNFKPTSRFKLAMHTTWGEGYYEQFQDDDNSMHDTGFDYYGKPDASFTQPDGTIVKNSDLVRRRMMDNVFYGATASFEHDTNWGDIVVGSAANRYDGEHFGRVVWMEQNPGFETDHEYYFNTSVKDEVSMFAKTQFSITENVKGYADLQYRGVNYTMEGTNSSTDKPDLDIDESYHFFNPKAGLSYTKGNQTLFASFGMAHREPTRANLKDAIGDPRATPKAETLYDSELGYKFASKTIAFEGSVYYMHYKDQLIPTGEKNNVGYDIMTNVPTSYRAGVELSASYKPVKWFRWDANVALSQNKIKDFVEYNTYYDQWYWEKVDYKGTERGDTPIAYSPNMNASSNLVFYPAKGMTVQFTTKYVGEQYFDNTGDDEAKIDAYCVSDLAIGYTHKLKHIESVECKFKVNNLFNKEYIGNAYGGKDMVQDENDPEVFHATRWTYYFPQAPTNFLVQVNFNF